jgi:ferredoxin-type protein NapF
MINKRELFQNIFFGKKRELLSPIRPPHSGEDFSECSNCEDTPCISVCEEKILSIGDKGVEISFLENGCSYCGECVSACQKDVLSINNIKKIKGKVELDILSCISWKGVICSSCKDVCLDKAINFLGMLRPEIESSKCTNCGFCISRCPTEAIKFNNRN